MVQAGDYSATHDLPEGRRGGQDRRRRQGASPDEEDADRTTSTQGHIRADGRMVHDMYLVEVKKPESKGPGTTTRWRHDPGRPGVHDQGRVQVRAVEVSVARPQTLRSCAAAPPADRPAGGPPRRNARRSHLTLHGDLRHPDCRPFGQLLLGLVNGSFYALLSLGLAVIFGLLNIINFAHGALYMMGAFVAWMLLEQARHRLLVGAGAGAAGRRRARRADRAH
jgi:hypothetical protein